jgi:hypothetical protein
MIKMSEILPLAKAWYNTPNTERSTRSTVRTLQYININTGDTGTVTVTDEELTQGGYFVSLSTTRLYRRNYAEHVVLGDKYSTLSVESVADSLRTLQPKLDLDCERVYLISAKTMKSKWFGKVMDNGEWLPLWDYVKESLGNLDIQALVNANDYRNIPNFNNEAVVYLRKNLRVKTSPMLNLINVASELESGGYTSLIMALGNLKLWNIAKGDRVSTTNAEEVNRIAKECYPYLSWHSLQYDYDTLTLKKIATYINAMDLYIDLSSNITSPISEEVAA